MTKSAFQSASNRWLLCLLCVMLALPAFAVVSMIPGVCLQPQGACFGVALIAMFWALPTATVIFSLLLLWSIGRRVKGLGMGVGWTAAATVWLLAGAPMLVFGGVGLIGTAFSGRWGQILSTLTTPPVTIVLFLLAFVAFLRRAEPGDVHPDDSARSRAMLLAAVAAAHVTVLHFGSALFVLRMIPALGLDALLRPLLDLLGLIAKAASFGIPSRLLPLIYWLDFAVFASALAYLISNQNEDDNVVADPEISPRPGGPLRASFGKRGT